MREQWGRFMGDSRVLHQRAVRTPLPTTEAERAFHRNMVTLAEARERRADLLADPDVSVRTAYEAELDHVAKTFERRLREIAGDDYESVAHAYHRGERDDRVGELTSYYLEGLWRIQQHSTVVDMMVFPIILRYPDSFTINVRFTSGYATTKSVVYESPEHSREELEPEHAETYYDESRYSQKQAAKYVRETAQIIREEFPDPDETSFEERKYGGFVSASGRRRSVFSTMLERVEPDPDRFSEPVDVPTLVPDGPEAKRTERELLPADDVVL